MNKIFALVISASLLLISNSAFAQKGRSTFSYSMPGIEGGFKWNTASQNGADTNKQVIGFQFGGSAVIDFTSGFGVKTGLFYSERPFESSFASGVTGKGKISYFEVPVLFMLKLEEYAGIYVGPSVAVKLAEEYTPGKLTGTKDIVIPISLGAQFKFMPNVGVNIFFETVPGELATGLENSRAVGANLLFTLD